MEEAVSMADVKEGQMGRGRGVDHAASCSSLCPRLRRPPMHARRRSRSHRMPPWCRPRGIRGKVGHEIWTWARSNGDGVAAGTQGAGTGSGGMCDRRCGDG